VLLTCESVFSVEIYLLWEFLLVTWNCCEMDPNYQQGGHPDMMSYGNGQVVQVVHEPPQGNATTRTAVGSLYVALDGYEMEARRRKHMITECEDTVESN